MSKLISKSKPMLGSVNEISKVDLPLLKSTEEEQNFVELTIY